MADLSVRDKYESALARIKSVKVHAKALTHEVVGTALAGATAGGLGAWDQAKGTVPANDTNAKIATAMVGPIPASLAIAAAGKVGAIMMTGDETGRLASAIGQGALDAYAYVMGRRLWANHAAAQTPPGVGASGVSGT
jgi:hypothetical protein